MHYIKIKREVDDTESNSSNNGQRRKKKRKKRQGARKLSNLLRLSSLWSTGLGWSAGVVWSTGLETVLEPSADGLEVSHSAGTGGLSSLSLLRPVVYNIRESG